MGVYGDASGRAVLDVAAQRWRLREGLVLGGGRVGQKGRLSDRARAHAARVSHADHTVQAGREQEEIEQRPLHVPVLLLSESSGRQWTAVVRGGRGPKDGRHERRSLYQTRHCSSHELGLLVF